WSSAARVPRRPRPRTMAGDPMDRHDRLATLDAVLRIAARHPNLLDEEAFEELVQGMAGPVGRGQISVLVPDGPRWFRVYAVSAGPTHALGFGERVPGVEPDWTTLLVEGRPTYCDDLRAGNAVERRAAQGGLLSYVAFPCRVNGPRPRAMRRGEGTAEAPRAVAILVLSYPDVGEARHVPADLLQEIADAIGPAIERAAHLSREHRLAMILETSSDAMLAWDRQGRVTDANSAAV